MGQAPPRARPADEDGGGTAEGGEAKPTNGSNEGKTEAKTEAAQPEAEPATS